MKINLSRRSFLKASAAASVSTFFVGSHAADSPNDQPAVGLIGCGGMGRGDAKNASRFGQIVAVCDVDERRMAEASKQFGNAKQYKDFREVMARDDIHAVICGTVDHWHTFVSMAAMRAGKDIYCEKPLTLTIDEGKR